jgi:hypothetical protein
MPTPLLANLALISPRYIGRSIDIVLLRIKRDGVFLFGTKLISSSVVFTQCHALPSIACCNFDIRNGGTSEDKCFVAILNCIIQLLCSSAYIYVPTPSWMKGALKDVVFSDMTPCDSSKIWRFGGIYCLRLQDDKALSHVTLKMDAKNSSETSVLARGTQLHTPEDIILYRPPSFFDPARKTQCLLWYASMLMVNYTNNRLTTDTFHYNKLGRKM